MEFTIHDYIKCKYLGKNFDDICNSYNFIRNTIMRRDSQYTVSVSYNDPNLFLKQEDVAIIEDAVQKWKTIIIDKVQPEGAIDLALSIYVETRAPNILASATCTDTNQYGIPIAGSVWINTSNWNLQKELVKDDGNTQAYYTVLHELGHVFGIGTIDRWNSLVQDGLYVGTHGLREYKNVIGDQSLIGLPIENDGGMGTSGSHLEEGAEYILSNNNRYHDGHFHPGLDRELMTGWAENDTGVEPLSRISVALLQDMGFLVNYTKADDFTNPSSGVLNVGEVITIDGNDFPISVEKNYLEYFPQALTLNISITSNQTSTLYGIYYQFENDSAMYSDSLKQNGTIVNEIQITNTRSVVDIVPNYQGNALRKVLLMFRN